MPSAQMRAPTIIGQQQAQEQRAQLLQAQQLGLPVSRFVFDSRFFGLFGV
jgi:hypothetical protein